MKIEVDLAEDLVLRITNKAKQLEMTLDAYIQSALTSHEGRESMGINPAHVSPVLMTEAPVGLSELLASQIALRKRRKTELTQLAQTAIAALLAGPVGVPRSVDDLVGPAEWDTLPYVQRVALGAAIAFAAHRTANVVIGERVNDRRTYTRAPEPERLLPQQ